MRLSGKVTIITGGGYSIGRVFSLGMAREGAKVVIADIDDKAVQETVKAIQSEGGEACAVRTDVSQQSDVGDMVDAAIQTFGSIDVLVNNAAIAAALPPRPLDDLDVAEWDEIMAVNLRGTFLCSKAVAAHMKQQTSGKIVNIASAVALTGHPERIAYAASKAGIIGLTRSLARSLGQYNICVNSLMPGSVASEGALAIRPLEHFEKAAAGRALKRVEYPEDLLGTLVYLSGPDSDFVTGQTILVDGGAEMR